MYISSHPVSKMRGFGVPPKRKADEIAQLNLRLPESLRSRIEAAAKKNGNSLNREILQRIEASFELQATTTMMQDALVKMADHMGLAELAQQVRDHMKKESEGNG
jgi:hypothetical protein